MFRTTPILLAALLMLTGCNDQSERQAKLAELEHLTFDSPSASAELISRLMDNPKPSLRVLRRWEKELREYMAHHSKNEHFEEY